MPRWGEGEAPEPRIDDRVLEVLAESQGRIAFNGLRRALQVHPESLTRALRRLERDGTIRRTEGSYELAAPIARESEPPSRMPVRTIASVALPPGGSREEVFGRLSGRWFGRLRWVGLFDHPGDPWLVWSVEGSGTHVMLSEREGRLLVLAEGGTDPVKEEVDDAAYDLLAQAVARLRELPRKSAPSLAYLAEGPDPRFGTPN
jgi:DNA-binding Lrp family transcriptional regulator